MADLLAIYLGADGDDVGIRTTKPTEWVKVTAVNSGTDAEVVYTFKQVKRVGTVLACGPFQVAVDNGAKTVTITPTVTIAEGSYALGLIEG